MRDAIIEKLRAHLTGPIDTECKVVYLVCEIRKLLDKHQPAPIAFALRLYCNWALHVNLSKPKTTTSFLTKVDTYVFDKLNSRETKETLCHEDQILREFIYLETFRAELRQFMAACALPTALCDEDPRWYAFLVAYAGVIEDGSLALVGKGLTKLRLVKKVTFTKIPTKEQEGHVPFGIKWNILLKDNRRLEVEVGTEANHDLMRSRLRLLTQ